MLASCNDASCYDNGSALPLVRFCASGSTTQVSIEGLTIRGIDAPGDSVLVQGGTTSEVYLPLRATTTCTQWELDYPADGSTPDTLTIAYQPIPYFASAECGAMYNFQISSATVTHHLIDSVQVVKPLIDNGTDVAIRLFFPTQ
ncbi:MAG: hypothetical protein IJT30_01530 [Muribaculaceae bacterium]|nr:hypothetical protein [Muribaculaceae bacterium]